MRKPVTLNLPPAFDKLVKRLVATGEFRDAEDVVLDTLRRLHKKEAARDALRGEIELGLADMEAGRYAELDAEEIKRKGRQLLNRRRKAG
jgi:putative addiction module CopG family antidote